MAGSDGCTFDQFNRQHMNSFQNKLDQLQQSWIIDIGELFRVLNYTDEHNIHFATYK